MQYTAANGIKLRLRYRAANGQYLFTVLKPAWEIEVFSLLQFLLPRTKVFFDIGANWGQHSLFACSLPDFSGCVHAFEPMPETYHDLEAQVNAAELHQRVFTHNNALGDVPGIAQMFIPKPTQTEQAKIGLPSKNAQSAKVEIRTLDQEFSVGKIPLPDLIKLDVEGFEANVLRGGLELLRQARPFIILENWPDASDASKAESLDILLQQNYALFEIAMLNPTTIELTEFVHAHRTYPGAKPDVFACPKEKVVHVTEKTSG
jgi:FkbM family methyltransferase